MGKSNELDLLESLIRAEGDTILRFRATELSGTPAQAIRETDEWEEHRSSGSSLTLLIDGIDEALPHHPGLLDALTGFLKRNAHPALRAFICLRSVAWDGRRHADLLRDWGTSENLSVYEICPLREEDLSIALQARGHDDPSPFITWIHDGSLGPLARIPIHIDSLIESWVTNPSQHVSVGQLRDQQISRLLKETAERQSSPIQTPILPDSKLEAISELIGVHAILSGHLRLQFEELDDVNSSILNLRRFFDAPLDGRWRCDSLPFAFSVADLQALLDRTLFTRVSGPGEPPAFSFAHHSFAERLAGRCMERQPLYRILRILCAGLGNRIAPQMEALTAMLASSHPALADWLLEHQPDILLQSDGLNFAPLFRALTVERVLRETEESDEHRRLEYSKIDAGFSCGEVAEVLVKFLNGTDLDDRTRYATITICARCPDPALASSLWHILNNEAEHRHLRAKALDAWLGLASYSPEVSHERIWQLARGEAGTGRAHDRADALSFLLKAGEPAASIIPLIPRSDENSHGSREMLIDHYLPNFLKPPELPDALKFLEKRGMRYGGGIDTEGLAGTVYEMVFANLDRSEILEAFARHWWAVGRRYHAELGADLRPMIDRLSDSSRQALLSALIECNDGVEDYSLLQVPLKVADLEWVVSRLPATTGPFRERWLKMVRWHWYQATKAEVPEWLVNGYRDGDEDFRQIFPTPTRNRSIEEAIYRFHRAGELRLERRAKAYQRKRGMRPKPFGRQDFTDVVEAQFRSNAISGWIRFASRAWHWMEGDDEASPKEEDGIRRSPGWIALSEDGRSAATNAARSFLESESAPSSTGTWTNGLEAGYLAMDLLEEIITTDPSLAKIVAERWIPAVIRRSNVGERRHQQLVNLAKSLDSQKVRREMIAIAKDGLEHWDRSLHLGAFSESWDGLDSEELLALMRSLLCGAAHKRTLTRRNKKFPSVAKNHQKLELRQAGGFAAALQFLANVDRPAACRLLASLSHIPLAMRKGRHRAVLVLVLLAPLRLPECMEKARDIVFSSKRRELRTAFNSVLSKLNHDYSDEGWLSKLNATQVALIYRSFVRAFPEMSKFEFRGGRVTLAEERRDFESSLMKRLSELGAAAEILQLLQEFKCELRKDSLRWYLRDARRIQAEEKWTPPRAAEISKWLIQEDGLLVRTEEDLKEAVLVSLGRFQDSIAREGRFVLDCWSRQKDGSYRPVLEEDLSARVADSLREDLERVIVSTEEQLRLGVKKQRTDIKVTLEVEGRRLAVIVEHKRAHNSGVLNDMKEQLVERYLIPAGIASGIYWVSWFDDFDASEPRVRNRLGVGSPGEARDVLVKQASDVSGATGLRISAFVLDCTKSSQ